MSIQDDITASEQELALLFEGALAGPLGPIRSEVDNSRRALEALENKVDGLQASLQWLCDDQKDAVEALISKCRDSVLSAQVEHTAHLCSQLESHAVERSMWLAAKLDEATSKHLQALLDWKDSLDHQVLALQAGVIAADQQLQDVSSHLHMQTQALQGLQDAGNALSGLSHESRSLLNHEQN